MPTSKSVLLSLTLMVVLVVLPSRMATSAKSAASQGSVSAPVLTFANGKICSGAVGGRFRDSVNVPDIYRISDCEALAKTLILGVARRSKGFTYNLRVRWGVLIGDEKRYFSNSITEDLITDLSRLSRLFVIACDSVVTYKGKKVG